jgi:WS/DGAT/MGAT family acyltransferase
MSLMHVPSAQIQCASLLLAMLISASAQSRNRPPWPLGGATLGHQITGIARMFQFSTATRTLMSKVDTAWLRMESPTNLMMITGVMVLEGQVARAALRRTLEERFLSYTRFRQLPVQRGNSWYWEQDPNFDIDAHLLPTGLPGSGDKGELLALVSRLASAPLDQAKPMWEVHLIEGYQGNTVLVVRIHHCYADGIALIQVMLSLTDVSAEGSLEHRGRSRSRRPPLGVLERLYRPASRGLEQALKLGWSAWSELARMLANPDFARAYARDGAAMLAELAHALTLPNDPATRFKGRLGRRKVVAWCEPIPLPEVKAVAKALDCTVNDVLLASVTGALREYLIAHGGELDGLEIRATVPVNLRPLEHAKELGNFFGLVFLVLPVGVANPLERLYLVKQRMQELKRSKQAVMTFGALAILGLAPTLLQRRALDLLSHKATAVATNVPGPQMPLYLAGQRVLEQMFWVPQSGQIGLGISILSYDGRVQFGIIADHNLVPDPQAVIDRFAGEFEKLLFATLMEPWDEQRPAAEVEATLAAWLRGRDPEHIGQAGG